MNCQRINSQVFPKSSYITYSQNSAVGEFPIPTISLICFPSHLSFIICFFFLWLPLADISDSLFGKRLTNINIFVVRFSSPSIASVVRVFSALSLADSHLVLDASFPPSCFCLASDSFGTHTHDSHPSTKWRCSGRTPFSLH